MAPILPGLSDDPAALRDVALAAREAGATHLWWNVLNLRPGTREHFLEHLARDWPEEVARYRRLYAGRAYLTAAQTAELNATLAEMRSEWVWAPSRPVQPPSESRRPPIEQLELRLAG
jgi:DNA repair photolyase